MDAMEGKRAQTGGFRSGCKGGYRRLEQRLGGSVWRVQSGGRAVGGGQKRLAVLTVTPKGGGGGSPPRSSARLRGGPTQEQMPRVRSRNSDDGAGDAPHKVLPKTAKRCGKGHTGPGGGAGGGGPSTGPQCQKNVAVLAFLGPARRAGPRTSSSVREAVQLFCVI